ncbi:MAG: hypothetical protein IPJ32_15415 [Sphingobacteriaceae bacterium]|nr:hypothetical protein [Sphingobacteriaceae bacterium]
MKIFINITFLLFVALSSIAQRETLNVGGTISNEHKVAMPDALVSVTKDGKAFTSFPTSFNGSYALYLPMGSEFVITVSKSGFAKKYFTVSTLGVSDESAKKKFSVMIADLELIETVPGVDYSIFNQPMNKYYYNPKIDNFEFDKKYMKDMLAQVSDLKIAKKEAILLAKLKAEQDKKDAELAAQKALQDERLAVEKAYLKNLEKEIEANKKIKAEEISNINPSTLTQPKPLVKDVLFVNTNSNINERIIALVAKYKTGVTEEIIYGTNVIIIQRVLVRDQMAWVYHKKMFNWGGVACFRDGQAITESIFESETRIS